MVVADEEEVGSALGGGRDESLDACLMPGKGGRGSRPKPTVMKAFMTVWGGVVSREERDRRNG